MDFGPVWAQLCFAAAGGALWDCWLWKRADFGKTRAQTLPGFARFCFQHANHRLRSLGAKGFSPLQKLKKKNFSVFLLSLGDPHCALERENTGQNKVGLFEGVRGFFGKGRVCVFMEFNHFGEQPSSKHFFFLHVLS